MDTRQRSHAGPAHVRGRNRDRELVAYAVGSDRRVPSRVGGHLQPHGRLPHHRGPRTASLRAGTARHRRNLISRLATKRHKEFLNYVLLLRVSPTVQQL